MFLKEAEFWKIRVGHEERATVKNRGQVKDWTKRTCKNRHEPAGGTSATAEKDYFGTLASQSALHDKLRSSQKNLGHGLRVPFLDVDPQPHHIPELAVKQPKDFMRPPTVNSSGLTHCRTTGSLHSNALQQNGTSAGRIEGLTLSRGLISTRMDWLDAKRDPDRPRCNLD
eukprot:CAMPEP_0119325798 /NCGR_PEP_ID=MMETSP1333-20130426/66718_1 /TAXON_ID=418940 /ORGANISM="Scyphosphaera apsteinii, Strain RCC1455" /LENGTH=169 /DNA_ID=CAMNT_0007333897 /DNA_START=71 /DNA_END=580 /DNA_ORIENTATION=+